jgi:NADPH2:quinone reductase
MKAVMFDQVASEADGYGVLALRDVPMPSPGPGEVLVRLACAAINPGDFLFISELYPDPKKPSYPQIAGTHGAGYVAERGEGVTIAPGTLVHVNHDGAWAEYAVVPAEWLTALPPAYPLEKAAQFINQVTAWDLLDRTRLKEGQWLVLNGGNSSVSIMLTQFARQRGIRTVSLVRKQQQDLRALGATEVLELGPGMLDRLDAITGPGAGCGGLHAVIDCIGGKLLSDLVRRLALGGRAIIYGGYDGARFELHNFDLLMRGATIETYIYRYFFTPPGPADRSLLQQIVQATEGPDFVIPIGGRHRLDDFRAAIDATLTDPARGKRFLTFGDRDGAAMG